MRIFSGAGLHWACGYLLDEIIALPEFLAAHLDQFVGMGDMVKVVISENENLGEPPVFRFMLPGIPGNLFTILRLQSGTVILRSTSEASNSRSSSSLSNCSVPVPNIAQSDQFALFEKCALHANTGTDFHDIVIDKVPFGNGFFHRVPGHDFVKYRHRVRCRGCGQADTNAIEVLYHLAPYSRFAGGISPVTFIGNDYIERVNRNIQFPSIIFGFVVAFGLRQGKLIAQKVYGHALDS